MRTATFILAVTAFPRASLANGQIPIAARDAPASVLVATRATTPPRLDGIDGDAVWAVAERRQDFRTFSPREDGEPTVRTEMRVAYDDRALYSLCGPSTLGPTASFGCFAPGHRWST